MDRMSLHLAMIAPGAPDWHMAVLGSADHESKADPQPPRLRADSGASSLGHAGTGGRHDPQRFVHSNQILQDIACGIDRSGKDVKITNLQTTLQRPRANVAACFHGVQVLHSQ